MSKPQKLPSGAWRVRFINADGSRESRTFPTYDMARAAISRLAVETEDTRQRRERFGSAEMTVAEAWEKFIAERKPDPNATERRFKSRGDAYRRHYDMHIKPHLADVRLSDLTPAKLRVWISTLAATRTARPGEKNERGRTLSASTVRAVITTLRVISKANDVPLTVALSDGLKQKRRRSRPKAFQCVADVRAFLGACREPWFRIAAAIACYCGARLGEVASLRWRHVGDDAITIATSWEGPLKARYEDDEEAARVVPLDPELAALLASWREVTHGGPDDHVVLVNAKRPMREHHDDVAAKTRSACKRAGVVPLTFHQLRATYATLVADAGLPVSKLSALMGHTNVSTTAIYIRPESEHAARDPRARIGGPVPTVDTPDILN